MCTVTIKMVISALVPSNERQNWLRIKLGSTPNAIMSTAEAFRVPDPVESILFSVDNLLMADRQVRVLSKCSLYLILQESTIRPPRSCWMGGE